MLDINVELRVFFGIVPAAISIVFSVSQINMPPGSGDNPTNTVMYLIPSSRSISTALIICILSVMPKLCSADPMIYQFIPDPGTPFASGHIIVDGTTILPGSDFSTFGFGHYELSTGPFVSLGSTSPPIVNAWILNYNTDVEFSMYEGLQHHQFWLADLNPLNQRRGTGTWELVSPAPIPDTSTTFGMLLFPLAVLALAVQRFKPVMGLTRPFQVN